METARRRPGTRLTGFLFLLFAGTLAACTGGRAGQGGLDTWAWTPPDWNQPDGRDADVRDGDGTDRDDGSGPGTDYGQPPTWDDVIPGTTAPATFALTAAPDCDGLTALWRRQAVAAMEADLVYGWTLVTRPRVCHEVPDEGYWGYQDAPPCDVSASDPGSSDSGSASQYSTTNTQEVDVDEADFLKNDGTYLYVLANGRFRVLKAWPPEQATPLSSVAIDGEPRSMFVHGDRAVIFSSLPGYGGYDPEDPYGYHGGYSECTYGYDCELTGDGRPLKVTVLDLADRAKPAVVREITFSGTFLAARRINDIVYAVLYSPPPTFPSLPSTPAALDPYLYRCASDPFPYTEQELRDLFQELHDANVKTIYAWAANALLPRAADRVRSGAGWTTLPDPFPSCDRYFLSAAGDGGSLLSLVSFDETGAAPLALSSVLTRPGAVYASKQSLYVAARHAFEHLGGWFPGEDVAGLQEATTLHKFTLDAGSAATSYAASGVARGRILNQFSLSEHEDALRVATTTGHLPGPATNAVRVFAQQGDRLKEVGAVEDLAPDEDIRSVRFDGDRGYVVTFKKTDPLFVLDLSDPTDPRVTGELKVPGFSTYMHFLDPTHLLTIGYDADDMGDFAWFDGIALSVFDVTDGSNPSLMHREVIGTRGTTSEAATNHLAFTWFPPKDALALPMVVCEGGGNGSFGSEMTFNGLLVYRVTLDGGFVSLGGIPHETPPTQDYQYYDPYYGDGCTSWWTQSNSTVKRSVFMDDWVFSVAMDEIRAARLDDLAHPVAVLPLKP